MSSTANTLCPFSMTYMKWDISKVQHQFNLTTFSPTVSSLTLLFNADPSYAHALFIGFVIDVDKNDFMFIGNKEKNISGYLSKHNSTVRQISFRPTYVLNTIQKQTKIYLNYQNYQRHYKGVFKNICP